jgi:hypothetical protein
MRKLAHLQSMRAMRRPPALNHHLIVAMALVVVVCLFVGVVWVTERNGKLIIKMGESEVHMDLGKTVELHVLLAQLFKDEQQQRETTALLKELHHLYKRDSLDLIDTFRHEPGDTELSEHLRSLLVALQGPFQRPYHHFYDITQPTIVDALVALGYTHPVAEKLRQLQEQAQGMFEERGVYVTIAFLAEGLVEGNAVVCAGSPYRGRDLLLINPTDPHRAITVFARDASHCIRVPASNDDEMFPIRIHLSDGRRLFGDRGLGDAERAILYPSPRGYTVRPQIITASTAAAQQ